MGSRQHSERKNHRLLKYGEAAPPTGESSLDIRSGLWHHHICCIQYPSCKGETLRKDEWIFPLVAPCLLYNRQCEGRTRFLVSCKKPKAIFKKYNTPNAKYNKYLYKSITSTYYRRGPARYLPSVRPKIFFKRV